MADIVTHNILYKQTCQQNTDYRIKQVQVIHPAHIKISGKQMLNQVYQLLTGAAIGSNLGRLFRMEQKTLMLLVGCGAAGAIAGIFKAPIAGLVFVIEAIQRREKEDKHTQHNTAEQELLPVHTQLAVHPFHPVHHPRNSAD